MLRDKIPAEEQRTELESGSMLNLDFYIHKAIIVYQDALVSSLEGGNETTGLLIMRIKVNELISLLRARGDINEAYEDDDFFTALREKEAEIKATTLSDREKEIRLTQFKFELCMRTVSLAQGGKPISMFTSV